MAKKKTKNKENKRLKRSYKAYSDWYDKYSKTSEMETKKMTDEELARTMAEYRDLGIKNPARTAAAAQKAINQNEARALSQTGKAIKEADLNNLRQTFPLLPDNPKKFTQKWIKKNFSMYYAMLQALGITWAEVVSPSEEAVD